MKKCTLLIVYFSISMSACSLSNTQKTHISNFGKATVLISDSSEAQFLSYKEKLYELQKRRVVMGKTTLDAVLNEAELHSDEKILILMAGVEALKSYGAALISLTSNDQSEEISKSTNKFLSQFESFKKLQDKTVDAKKKQAATDAINAVGGMIVEYKKKKAIEEIILAYSDDVELIAEFLLQQFKIQIDKCKTRTGNDVRHPSMTDNYCTISSNTEYDADRLIANTRNSNSVAYAKETKYIVIQERNRVVARAKENVAILEKFSKANKSLTEVIRNDKHEPKEILSFLKQAHELNINLKVLF